MASEPEAVGPTGAASPPPNWLPSVAIPIFPVDVDQPLFRIHHSKHDPVFYGPEKDKPPEFRFDSTSRLFGVLYLGLSFEGAFVETILRNPQRRLVNRSTIRVRSSSQLVASRGLRMAKMFDEGLSALGTDNAISSGPYEPCGLWADALWRHPDRVDGIAYRSRFDNGQICLAVFERGTVTFTQTGSQPLDSMTKEVAGLLDRYNKSLVDTDF